MKYFAVEQEGQADLLFTTLTPLRAYLRRHPEITKAYRYWWCRDDLIECKPIHRADIMHGGNSRALMGGATAQWAEQHGVEA